MTTKEYADGLRQLADWYDQHPDAPLPYQAEKVEYIEAEKEATAAVIRAFGGHWDKRAASDLLWFTRPFGPFTLELVVNQSVVCERKVVRLEIVPAQPAYTREVVEWDCGSLLGEVSDPA